MLTRLLQGRRIALGLKALSKPGFGLCLGAVRGLAAVDQDLLGFPEYQCAKSDMANGHFKRALPGLLRVQAVITNAVGPASPVTVYLALRAAQAMQYMGEFDRAIEQVQSVANSSAPLLGEDRCRVFHAASLLHLFSGSASLALREANKALALCESDSSVPTSLFSPTHGLIGLCNFHVSHRPLVGYA